MAVRAATAGLLAAAYFQQAVTHRLLDNQPQGLPAVILRAMDFCAEQAAEPISTADIARAAHTGIRSLQRAFRTHLDMAPLEYLRQVRLHRAHEDLAMIARGQAEGTVAEVAMRWGFTHIGRFSGQYRERYGRTPGQALRAEGQALAKAG
jgi:transcriptional regulator GlxA family with amidase domain